MSKFEYAKLADAVAAEIASGALKPGDRLPPQRSFAYERKIATSTASRGPITVQALNDAGRALAAAIETLLATAQPGADLATTAT